VPTYTWPLSTPPSPVGTTISIDVPSVVAGAGLSTDFGTDITTWQGPSQTEPDLDPTFTEIDGRVVVAQACARRLSMHHGALPDDPDAGYDLRRFCNAKWVPAKAFSIKTGVERECMKDPRVYMATAQLKYFPKTRTMEVEVYIETMFGSFALVLAVDNVSVTILRAA